MQKLVELRVKALKEKTYAELLQLLAYQDEKLGSGRSTIILSTWREAVHRDELKIIVQAYRYLFLGIGRMETKGFLVDSMGNIRDLSRGRNI